MRKPILCLDFDGVIHSYSSPWTNARTVPDVPVPGALEFVVGALDEFRVCVFSSRSHQWGGRRAMRRWFRRELASLDLGACLWWEERIYRSIGMDPWDEEVRYAIDLVMQEIKFPLFKPPAMVTIDDRALTFTGEWPSLENLAAFRPWNKR